MACKFLFVGGAGLTFTKWLQCLPILQNPTLKAGLVNTASIVTVIILIEFIINPMYGLNRNFLLLPEYMHYVHHKLDNIQEPQVLLQCVHSLNIPKF